MRIPFVFAFIACLSLPAGADQYWPGPSDNVTPTATGLTLASEDGITRAELPFGTGFQDTMHTLIGVFGHELDVFFPQECGAGPLVSARIPTQITLMFQDDRFGGWFLNTGDLMTTDTGLTPGAPLADLTATGGVDFFESGLGTEFEAAGVYGLLSEDGARIQAMWTGLNCIFR